MPDLINVVSFAVVCVSVILLHSDDGARQLPPRSMVNGAHTRTLPVFWHCTLPLRIKGDVFFQMYAAMRMNYRYTKQEQDNLALHYLMHARCTSSQHTGFQSHGRSSLMGFRSHFNSFECRPDTFSKWL